jgi:RNA binding exosome subunit
MGRDEFVDFLIKNMYTFVSNEDLYIRLDKENKNFGKHNIINYIKDISEILSISEEYANELFHKTFLQRNNDKKLVDLIMEKLTDKFGEDSIEYIKENFKNKLNYLYYPKFLKEIINCNVLESIQLKLPF